MLYVYPDCMDIETDPQNTADKESKFKLADLATKATPPLVRTS